MNSKESTHAQKIVRKAHRKVKSGCRTCKSRRVRCDESFPVCNRCQSAGRVCDGYGIWGGGTGALHDRHTPPEFVQLQPSPSIASGNGSPASTTISVLEHLGDIYHPPLGPRITLEEQAYLDWFLRGTAIYPPQLFASPLWCSTVLQMFMKLPVVIQALSALSSAHRQKETGPVTQVLAPDAQEMFLLFQYNEAMKNMRRYLSNQKEPVWSELPLCVTMCGLFMLLEITRGDYDAAYVHLRGGTQLAKELTETRHAEANISRFFDRLNYRMEAFREPQYVESNSATRLDTVWAYSRQTSNRDVKHMKDAMEGCPPVPIVLEETPNSAETQLSEEGVYLVASFDAWLLEFEAVTADKVSNMTTDEAVLWHNLRKKYGTLNIAAHRWLGIKIEGKDL